MKRDLPILLALIVAALLPPQWWQQLTTPTAVSGVVVAVSPVEQRLSVRGADGRAWEASTSAGTSVMQRGERGPVRSAVDRIGVGDRISIRGEIELSKGAVLARSMMVTPNR